MCAGAVEKQKMVYVLNRDQAANLTISSPLDAHKSHHLVFSVTGLDVGFDNPVFAAIELDYADADQVKTSSTAHEPFWAFRLNSANLTCYNSACKLASLFMERQRRQLTFIPTLIRQAFVTGNMSACLQDPTGEAAAEAQKHLSLYELDLGLNHVSRKWSQPVDNGANMLIPVPGGGDGPGGVLVCAENFIIYNSQVRPLLPQHQANLCLLSLWRGMAGMQSVVLRHP